MDLNILLMAHHGFIECDIDGSPLMREYALNNWRLIGDALKHIDAETLDTYPADIEIIPAMCRYIVDAQKTGLFFTADELALAAVSMVCSKSHGPADAQTDWIES